MKLYGRIKKGETVPFVSFEDDRKPYLLGIAPKSYIFVNVDGTDFRRYKADDCFLLYLDYIKNKTWGRIRNAKLEGQVKLLMRKHRAIPR